MEPHSRSTADADGVLACFTVDRHRLRVVQAANGHRADGVGSFQLDGVSYMVVASPERDDSVATLTRREREIALQIAKGRGTKQIAYDLGISPHTAMTYVNRIRTKLGVRNRPEMVAALLGG